MVFRAGEVLQRGAERLLRDDAEIDLQTMWEANRHLRIPSPDEGRRRGKLCQTIHDGIRIVGDNEQVEIADRFASATVAASRLELQDPLGPRQMFLDRVYKSVGLGPVDPFACLLGER